MEGDTTRLNRVLALWLDLQSAIQSRSSHVNREKGCEPWACPDQRVREAWRNLAQPRNAMGLEELFCQLPHGPQLEMVRKALQDSRAQE